MGPGGLDPVEVFESLPEELQECFRSSDVERLKQVSKTMVDFDKHFKRCVDAGLWQSGKWGPMTRVRKRCPSQEMAGFPSHCDSTHRQARQAHVCVRVHNPLLDTASATAPCLCSGSYWDRSPPVPSVRRPRGAGRGKHGAT